MLLKSRLKAHIEAMIERYADVVDNWDVVNEAISDDMLLCIDALRWGQSDLNSLVPDGDRRRAADTNSSMVGFPAAKPFDATVIALRGFFVSG